MLMFSSVFFGQVQRTAKQETAVAILVNSILVILISGIVALVFLQSLSRCLAKCSPENRTMKPGQVWLNLIPVFGFVWMFITVIRISESLRNEFRARSLRSDDPQFAKTMGIVFLISSFFCGPIGLIPWILYWVKIARYGKQLTLDKKGGKSAKMRRRDDDEEDEGRPQRRRARKADENDDRPRKKRRGGDDEDD